MDSEPANEPCLYETETGDHRRYIAAGEENSASQVTGRITMDTRLGYWALGMGAAAISTALLVPIASSASAATIQPSQQSRPSQAACGFTAIEGTQEDNALALRATNGDTFVLEVQNQFGSLPAPFGNTDLWERTARQSSFTQAPDQPTYLAGPNLGRLQTIPASDGTFYAALIPQTTLAVGDPIIADYNTCTYTAAAFGYLPFASTP
jgi:hypothetical protein